MKTWKNPVATVQVFIANEYVSACEPMELVCDLCLDEVGPGKTYDRLHIKGTMEGGAMDGQEIHARYYGCGEKYTVECGELSKITATHYCHYTEIEGAEVCGNHWLVPMESPVTGYFWGDGHGTQASFELNKS